MVHMHVESSATVDAPPETVYALLADYRERHPQILPADYFHDLQIEAGGQGAGTVFRVSVRTGGMDRLYHMDVSEPQPGHLLVEADRLSSTVTRFTVSPADNGAHAQVRIASEWEPAGGLAGLLERLFAPMIMRRIYTKELRQLATVLAQRPAVPADPR